MKQEASIIHSSGYRPYSPDSIEQSDIEVFDQCYLVSILPANVSGTEVVPALTVPVISLFI